MMELIPKEIAEKDSWNEFLEKAESGHLFQTFEWGVFKEAQGWKIHRITLQDSDGEIKAVLSILEKRIPLFGFKIWYLPRGPVWDFQDRELTEQVFDSLIDFARKNKVFALKISPDMVLNEKTKWIPELLKNKGFKEARDYQLHKCTIRINLRNDLEKIFSNFKKNTRWEIKKAEKDGVVVKKGESETNLKSFYQLYAEAMGKDRLPYNYFKNLWEVFKKNILILVAFYQGKPLSAVFVPFFNKKCWYLFGGSTKKYPTHNSSQALQWETMRQAKTHDADFYDLQGIPCGKPKSSHDKGVLQFKEGFGGKRAELIGEFDYAFFPILYQIFRKLNQARIITKGIIGRV
jgi:peptidoglycan pentaglycine glycine transferase (the first glycine)